MSSFGIHFRYWCSEFCNTIIENSCFPVVCRRLPTKLGPDNNAYAQFNQRKTLERSQVDHALTLQQEHEKKHISVVKSIFGPKCFLSVSGPSFAFFFRLFKISSFCKKNETCHNMTNFVWNWPKSWVNIWSNYVAQQWRTKNKDGMLKGKT